MKQKISKDQNKLMKNLSPPAKTFKKVILSMNKNNSSQSERNLKIRRMMLQNKKVSFKTINLKLTAKLYQK